MGRIVSISIIAALTALQIAFGAPDIFLGDGSWWLRAATYSFFHASFWHLAVNGIAVWTIYSRDTKMLPAQMLASYAIAVIVYPLSLRPVIGFSNILYATLGLRTPPLRSRWWRQPPVAVFLAVTVLMLFIPQFSATTHIAAFVLGMAGAALNRWWLNITRDARRYL